MGDPDTDLGLFGPDSVSWRVHQTPVVAVGGLRALYLQALHPREVAGVVQNSSYRADPWGRLARTASYVATTVYGTTGEAERAGRRVRAVHARMRATDPVTGEQFRLDDPELLRWVHVTEVDSFLDSVRRGGLDLSDADADTYLGEQLRAAALVGLDPATVPASVADVAAYFERMRPQLAMTVDAAQTAVFLSVPPLPYGLGLTPARSAMFGLAALAVGSLPGWARRMYGLPGLPVTGRLATLNLRLLHTALRAVPQVVFQGPIYRAAMRRVAAREAAGTG